MRKEANIEFKVTSWAAPLQIEGTIKGAEGERRPFYFRNRSDTIYCEIGEWTELDPTWDGSVRSILSFDEENFSIRQRVPVDEKGFAKEVSLKEALGFVMMAHELSA